MVFVLRASREFRGANGVIAYIIGDIAHKGVLLHLTSPQISAIISRETCNIAGPDDEYGCNVNACIDLSTQSFRVAGGERKKLMTIKEFAERLGLSTATVSRAFTPGAHIRPETRARILEQARAQGYAPNPSARNLAGRRNRLIGLDCPANTDILADAYLVELARGVQAALEPRDYGLLLNTRPRPGTDMDLLNEWVFGHAVDGVVIVVPPDFPLLTLCPFVGRDVPCVLITQARNVNNGDVSNNEVSDRVLPAVELDLTEGARAALTHLVRLGHREIGLITSAPNDSVRQIYYQVYHDVLGVSGSPDPRLTVETTSTIAAGRAAMHRLLAAPKRPTAVFCRTDLLALGALRAARDMGLRVPEDLSVIGHDDLLLAELADPPLTTVRIDKARIGQEATDLLLASLLKRDPSADPASEEAQTSPSAAIPTVTIASELIVRRSTARCPTQTVH
jgi:DNA-binding LacI/PurR family transcriptional regulator